MKWSWKIARIADIDIYIHATFFLIIYLVGMSYWNQEHTIAAVISGVGLILALFTCVVLHELGHSLTARRYGIQTRNITLFPIGGVAALEKMPDDPVQEIIVALAGPAVNFVIAAVLFLYIDISGLPAFSEELAGTGAHPVYTLMVMNLFLGCFNLLPAFPMDGGRVLRATLALRMDHAKATQKAATVGKTLAVGMGLLGLAYNPLLVLIAAFIWLGASVENSTEQIKHDLANATVRHAMLSEYHTLLPEDTLREAVRLTLAGSQKDFPVGRSDRPSKILYQGDLLRGIQELGEDARITELTLQDIHTADIDEPLEKLLERMQNNPAQVLCVVDRGKFVGLLNLENIMELIRIHRAVEQHREIENSDRLIP
jgi:Zn-dependent protease/CBS domain-containing protein